MAEQRIQTPAQPQVVGPRRGALQRTLGVEWKVAALFILPLVLLIVGLIAYPFLAAVYLSFTTKLVGEAPRWAGLRNYTKLANDSLFRQALLNTMIYTLSAVAVKLLLGMGMALVLNTRIRWRGLWAGLLLIPWVAPTTISALNWLWMYDYTLGIVNHVLVRQLGLLSQGVGWLSERQTALPAVIAVNIWRGFPFFGVTLLAGLKAIPSELYEAAEVDGAQAWHRFRYITLPSLRNVMIITTLLSTIWTFNDFQIIWVLTKGGPGGATMTAPILTYETAFGAQRLGEAVAISIYLLPVLAVLIVVLARYMRRGAEQR